MIYSLNIPDILTKFLAHCRMRLSLIHLFILSTDAGLGPELNAVTVSHYLSEGLLFLWLTRGLAETIRELCFDALGLRTRDIHYKVAIVIGLCKKGNHVNIRQNEDFGETWSPQPWSKRKKTWNCVFINGKHFQDEERMKDASACKNSLDKDKVCLENGWLAQDSWPILCRCKRRWK